MKRYLIMQHPTAWHGEMWREGAPCGNATVGALVYGGIQEEIILLNHTLLWRGGNKQEMPDISDSLAKIRAYLDDERPDLANTVFTKAFTEKGYNTDITMPLPLCDVRIIRHSEKPTKHYRRVIDMEAAEVTVSWEENSVHFTRSTFVSRADGLFYTRIKADKPGQIDIGVTVTVHDRETLGGTPLYDVRTEAEEGYILYAGNNDTSTFEPARGDYGAVLRVLPTGGNMTVGKSELCISGADEVLLVGDVFVGKKREEAFAGGKEKLASPTAYEDALSAHTVIFAPLFKGVDFSVSDEKETSNEELLLETYDIGMPNELAEKMYAYGRYLFLCATDDKNALPMHLVGLWSGTYQAFWAIHMFNINLEMIYWNALSGNLPSYLRLMLDYVEGFLPDFRENAKKMYGCRGIWIDSVNTPETGLAACRAEHIVNWTGGAAWISQHFYDYYRYTGDTAYLREHALPFMAETALFYEDFLYTGEDGKFVFAPSASPENVPKSTREKFRVEAQCTRNAAMDISLVRELLTNLLEGARRTGLYADKYALWEEMLTKLPDYRINEDGSLAEWTDPFYEDNHYHRHQSHMYALFPGHEVTPASPLFDAFVRAEDRRFNEGLSQMSSWSMVFMACVNARMRRGDQALLTLSEMVKNCCMNNLFTVHNDWRRMGSVMCEDMRFAPFQIDANVGFPAAVNEMLLGCADGTIVLFPALPTQWKKGYIKGLFTVGGYHADLTWNETEATAVITGGFAETTVSADSGWKIDGENTLVPGKKTVLTLKRS